MPLYETLVMIRARCAPADLLNVVRRAAEDLTRDGGVIRRLDNLGKRPLAYSMTKQKQKSRFAYLYRFQMDCSPSSLAQMDRAFRLDENVLRFMTTRLNPKKLIGDDIESVASSTANKSETPMNGNPPTRSTTANSDPSHLAWLYNGNACPVRPGPIRPSTNL